MSFGGHIPGKGNGGRLARSLRGNAAAAGAVRPPAPEAGTAEIESPSPAGPASEPGADFIGVERGGTPPPG